MPATRYEPALDGVRALAVIGVLVFHVTPTWVRGGFVGVDVFFVLSGYLITSIVVRGVDEGSFSLTEFYIRRALRLLPNLVAMVGCVLLAQLLLQPAADAVETAHHAIWTLLSASNFYIYLNLGGYWGDGAKTAALTHAWSLGIEEQFYLLFPLAVLAVARARRTALAPFLWVCLLSSLLACVAMTSSTPDFAFYMAPTRAWELLAGAALALRRDDGPYCETTRNLAGMAALGTVLACFLMMESGAGFPGWVAAIPTLATVALIWSTHAPGTLVVRLLSIPVIVTLGKLSYSIYLWHWPVITLAKRLADDWQFDVRIAAVGAGILSIAVAVLLYGLVETPMRSESRPRGRRIAILAGGLAATTAIALTIIGTVHPLADPNGLFDRPVSYGQYFNAGTAAPAAMLRAPRYYDVEFPRAEFSGRNAWKTGGIVRQHGAGDPRVVVLGSSHALMFSGTIDRLCRERGVPVAFFGVDGAPALFQEDMGRFVGGASEATRFNQARLEALRRWKPRAVVCIDRWEIRIQDPERFANDLRALVREVDSWGGEVVFLPQVPALDVRDRVNLREFVSESIASGLGFPAIRPDAGGPSRALAEQIAARMASEGPGLEVINVKRAFTNPDGSVRYLNGRRFLYLDNDHLTEDGAELVRAEFERVLP